ncbi:zinc finger protein 718-like [Uranotaenia lowii]|uniref:zinc finger protein 718-like n=1 Tax=Uranotaenia lowii TaxID=190385 RepID=UPI00247A30F1|nr:zinc finger protein 718-like [Uranotaenia lowii]
MAVYNLSTFPDVCRLCLQSKHPDELISIDIERPQMDRAKLGDLLEELTFKIPSRVSSLMPKEICSMCLEVFEFFYKYKQKVYHIHQFLVAFVDVRLGNSSPLVQLFNDRNEYYSMLFKDLDLCNKDELLVEDMLAEYPQYLIASLDVRVKQEIVVEDVDGDGESEKYDLEVLEKENPDVSLVDHLQIQLENDTRHDDDCLKIMAESEDLDTMEQEQLEVCDSESNQSSLDQAEALSNVNQNILLEFVDTEDTEDISTEVSTVKKRTIKKRLEKPIKTLITSRSKHKKLDSLSEGIHCKYKGCSEVFSTREQYQKHQKSDAHKQHLCPICGFALKHKHSLKVHMARHVENPEFRCQFCSASFYTKTERKNHQSLVHSIGANCKCDQCGLLFKSKKLLNQHQESHVLERNYTCDTCDFAFKTHQHLRRHVTSVHLEVRYNCDLCEASYKRKDKLKMHMEKAHSIQSYFICDICVRSFKTSEALTEHKDHHANPKPLECSTCLIAHDSKAAFDTHECITYREDYICCDRDFHFHLHYNRHMLTAHGVRCNVRVKPKDGVLVGQLKRAYPSSKRPVKRCGQCGKSFRTAVAWRKHVGSGGSCTGAGEMGEEEHLENMDDMENEGQDECLGQSNGEVWRYM